MAVSFARNAALLVIGPSLPGLALHAPRALGASVPTAVGGSCPPNSRPPFPQLVTAKRYPAGRTLATMSTAVVEGQEQVLERPWWPDDAQMAGSLSANSMPPSSAMRFILELASHLDPAAAADETQEETGAKLSASVAVVLRLVSSKGDPLSAALCRRISEAVTLQQRKQRSAPPIEAAPGISEESIREVLVGEPESHHGKGVAIELLYISRTVVGKDGSRDARRWSGQIAFPGGKRQGDETHLQTACRECREEVALDLQGPDFMLLGSLPARKAKSDMELNAFVFLHTGGGADLRPEASEVADAWWVPLPAVASRSRVQTLFRSISTAQDIPRLLRCCLQTLGVRGLLFPCLCLPPPTVSSSRSSSSRQPPLWGLTLGLTSDLLATGRIDCCGGHSPTNPLEVRSFEFGNARGEPMPWMRMLADTLASAYQGDK